MYMSSPLLKQKSRMDFLDIEFGNFKVQKFSKN